MSCRNCGQDNCGCVGKTPFYQSDEVCPEDHCEKIYVNEFSFGVCPDVSWNVPGCGLTAILSVQGVRGASIGSFIWNTNYGYFKITSIDTDKGQIGILNTCISGNAAPGTQIPKCTCFVITDTPQEQFNPSNLFPYVAIDFTAPAISSCVDITLTAINGLAVGDTISIGSGFYTLDSFVGGSVNVIKICNDGDGILPGTSVIAKDQFGNYLYPINVVSNCCSEIDATIAAAIATDVPPLIAAAVSDLAGATDGEGINTAGFTLAPLAVRTIGPVTLTMANPSATHIMRVMAVYSFNIPEIFPDGTGEEGGVVAQMFENANGGGYVNIGQQIVGAVSDIAGVTVNASMIITVPRSFSIPPGITYTYLIKIVITSASSYNMLIGSSTLSTTFIGVAV